MKRIDCKVGMKVRVYGRGGFGFHTGTIGTITSVGDGDPWVYVNVADATEESIFHHYQLRRVESERRCSAQEIADAWNNFNADDFRKYLLSLPPKGKAK